MRYIWGVLTRCPNGTCCSRSESHSLAQAHRQRGWGLTSQIAREYVAVWCPTMLDLRVHAPRSCHLVENGGDSVGLSPCRERQKSSSSQLWQSDASQNRHHHSRCPALLPPAAAPAVPDGLRHGQIPLPSRARMILRMGLAHIAHTTLLQGSPKVPRPQAVQKCLERSLRIPTEPNAGSSLHCAKDWPSRFLVCLRLADWRIPSKLCRRDLRW